MESYLAAGFGFFAVTLMGIGISQLRKIGERQGQHEVKLTRIEVVLTGADGTNGINGEVKQLRRRVDEWDRRIGESDRRHSA
jgi:hypothetical protein